jgi:hypothetical protein
MEHGIGDIVTFIHKYNKHGDAIIYRGWIVTFRDNMMDVRIIQSNLYGDDNNVGKIMSIDTGESYVFTNNELAKYGVKPTDDDITFMMIPKMDLDDGAKFMPQKVSKKIDSDPGVEFLPNGDVRVKPYWLENQMKWAIKMYVTDNRRKDILNILNRAPEWDYVISGREYTFIKNVGLGVNQGDYSSKN